VLQLRYHGRRAHVLQLRNHGLRTHVLQLHNHGRAQSAVFKPFL
jgi:hypothetical protein